MRHDFTKLSGLDFEELVHDLLQRAWSTRLEIFKGGRDGGVDLRALVDGGTTVVQCKNYAPGSFAALRARLRDDELPKIRRLAPRRYVLVTSLELTVAQADEIFALLRTATGGVAEVVGGTELERMLEDHPDVVRRHHKLWLSSVAVLERVLHAAEHAQTAEHVERVVRKLPLYVETRAYDRAMDAVERHRVVILSGAPGIGKSTVADMMLYAHMADGFSPAVIRAGLGEGRRLAASGAPTIFHFDDFLGQTFLGDRPDFLGRREDADLVEFIEWVRESGRHRFVLTTREHVLSDAVRRSERLRHAGIADDRCLVTVDDFRRAHRARILYNHVHFSGLPLAHRHELLRDDLFLEIVDSDDFNPRVVEWLSSRRRLARVDASHYREHVRALLANPHDIWWHAYRHELSQPARDLLVTLHGFSHLATLDHVRRSFEALHARSTERLRAPGSPTAFTDALRETEGAFVELGNGALTFINPSVRDFLSGVMREQPELALDVLHSAVTFSQVADLWTGSAADGPFPTVRPVLERNTPALADAFARTLRVPTIHWTSDASGMTGRFVDDAPTERTATLLRLRRALPALAAVTAASIEALADAVRSGDVDLPRAASLLARAWRDRAHGDWTALGPVVAAVACEVDDARAEGWLALLDLRTAVGPGLDAELPGLEAAFQAWRRDRLDDERLDCGDLDDLETLHSALRRLAERHGVELSDEIGRLERAIAEAGEPEAEEPDEVATAMREEEAADPDDDELRLIFTALLEDTSAAAEPQAPSRQR